MRAIGQDATIVPSPLFHGSMDDELCTLLATDLDGGFEALVLRHQDRLYTIAVRLLGDPRDAEEIAQDAFVRAYRALASWEPARIRELHLRAWLATIVVNLCRNRATRRARRAAAVTIDGGGPDGASLGAALPSEDRRGSPHETAIRREELTHWSRLLAGLPPRYRMPIVLHHVDGLSIPEVARVLGRPEGTLKAQVHRGLAMLRAAHEAAARAAGPADQVHEELSA
jgi:RNA polymerase sigma-70 factor, ECF subfamily